MQDEDPDAFIFRSLLVSCPIGWGHITEEDFWYECEGYEEQVKPLMKKRTQRDDLFCCVRFSDNQRTLFIAFWVSSSKAWDKDPTVHELYIESTVPR